MTKKKRCLALITAIALLFVMLFSAAYIVKNSNHDCCGNAHCPICYHISVCRDVLKALLLAVGVHMSAALLSCIFYRLTKNHVSTAKSFTPISLKVKLLN